ncbi:hypothetical protein N7527_012131 [Penicillium freii]|nr:hypothetical protein N7527_012131 [Penicillium freii]
MSINVFGDEVWIALFLKLAFTYFKICQILHFLHSLHTLSSYTLFFKHPLCPNNLCLTDQMPDLAYPVAVPSFVNIYQLLPTTDRYENLTSTTAETRDSVMSNHSDSPDIECFEALPADTFEAIGSSASAIRRIIEQQKGLPIQVVKYLCFRNVPPSIAEKVSSSSTRQMFNHDTRSMIIKLVTRAHQTASRGLCSAVQCEMYNMGLEESICPVGGTTIQGMFSSKEADKSFSLLQPVPGRGREWPIITVEGQVKLVVIMSINPEIPEIKFETVVLDPVVHTIHQRPYVPTVRQSIMTSRPPKQPGAQISVCPAVPLTIGFEELFCRQPVPPEHNIELSPDRLGQISEHVWGVQGL